MTLDEEAERAVAELERAYVKGELPLMIRVMKKVLKQLRRSAAQHRKERTGERMTVSNAERF